MWSFNAYAVTETNKKDDVTRCGDLSAVRLIRHLR